MMEKFLDPNFILVADRAYFQIHRVEDFLTFFRCIKQHLNIPTLFGTTENAVFNQLYAALLAYVICKTLHEERRHHPFVQGASFIRFTRQLLEAELRVEWQLIFQSFIKSYK